MINVIAVFVGLALVISYIVIEKVQPNMGMTMIGVVLIICGLL